MPKKGGSKNQYNITYLIYIILDDRKRHPKNIHLHYKLKLKNMPFPLIPIIAAGGTLLSQGIQQIGAKKRLKRQTAANMQLSEHAYAQDLDMWNKQNKYNDPSAQMLRLRNAGLNPNMVYGQGTVAGNTSGSAPKFNAPRVEREPTVPLNFQGAISQFQDVQQRSANIDLTQSQIALTDQKAATERFLAALKGNEVGISKTKLRQMIELFPGQFQAQQYENKKRLADIRLKGAEFGIKQSTKEKIDFLNKYFYSKGLSPGDAPWIRAFLNNTDFIKGATGANPWGAGLNAIIKGLKL